MPLDDVNGPRAPLALPPGPTREPDDAEPPAEDVPPWEEPDFSPVFTVAHGEFTAEGGETYRDLPGKGRQQVCGFVPVVLGETVTVNDIDNMSAGNKSVDLNIRIATPDSDANVVVVPVRTGRTLSGAIVDAVPSGLARLAVGRPADVGPAARAFTSPAFFRRTIFAQTGWLPDGSFGFPGSAAVSLDRLGISQGIALLDVPEEPDLALASHGGIVLSRLCSMAPTSVTVLVLATILAGPLFRRAGARAFLVLLAGSSQAAKTPLISRFYSLLGRFYEQPGCIATWTTTPTTIEAYLHGLRDLPVLIDNYRAQDGSARETFRKTVIALGDGAGRARSAWTQGGMQVVGASDPRSLVLATGEHGYEDDAAVNGRMIQLAAQDIDRRALLRVQTTDLTSLPHLFSAFVAFLRAQPPEQWLRWHSEMLVLSEKLTDQAEARTSEHLATLITTFDVFLEFIEAVFPEQRGMWGPIAEVFGREVPDIAETQASRVRDDQLDRVVLREIARGVRQGKAYLEPIGAAPPAQPKGEWLGGFDGTFIFLVADLTAKWANEQLGSRRGARVGRTTLGEALRGRCGGDGVRRQVSIGGRRLWVWPIRRQGLDDAWDGLLDAIPAVGD
jgi:hypothetical protein